MQKRTKWGLSILTGFLAVATVLGAFTFRSVYAQAPTPTPGASDTQTAPGLAAPDQAVPSRDRAGRFGAGVTDANLASALGITTEQLQAAYETANAEALKEAVAQGLITQAQADQMSANAGGKHILGRFGKPGSTGSIDYDALLAKALNITPEKLQAARQTALTASLDAALKAGTLTQAQVDRMLGMQALSNDSAFQTALQTAYELAIKQAVSSGVITQAQADAILAAQNQNGGFFGRGPGFGFDGGPGGHGGRGGPGLNGTPDTQNN